MWLGNDIKEKIFRSAGFFLTHANHSRKKMDYVSKLHLLSIISADKNCLLEAARLEMYDPAPERNQKHDMQNVLAA
jgi:hypothetical protein